MLYDGKVWSSAEGGGVSSREDDLIDPATGVSMPVVSSEQSATIAMHFRLMLNCFTSPSIAHGVAD